MGFLDELKRQAKDQSSSYANAGANMAIAKKAAEMRQQKCAKCKAPVQYGERFCKKCGAPQLAACPKCKAEFAIGTKFCASCGTALG